MKSRHFIYISLWAAWQAGLPALSQGELLITPTRLVFEDRTRTGTLNLLNRGSETSYYRLFFSEKRMNAQGVLVDLEPGEQGRFASPMVRFSPRRVRLEPGQSQKIRLLCRPDPNLEPGEYRSHLVFQALPEEGGYRLAPSEGEEDGIGIRLTPLVGASIPIIVRRGELSTTVRMAEAQLTYGDDGREPNLSVEFRREGKGSVYGDILVQWIQDRGEPREIGLVKGMAVYPELDRRRLEIPLAWTEDLSVERGKLNIRYISPEREGRVLAEFSLQVR